MFFLTHLIQREIKSHCVASCIETLLFFSFVKKTCQTGFFIFYSDKRAKEKHELGCKGLISVHLISTDKHGNYKINHHRHLTLYAHDSAYTQYVIKHLYNSLL
jgi:hypothetical protein